MSFVVAWSSNPFEFLVEFQPIWDLAPSDKTGYPDPPPFPFQACSCAILPWHPMLEVLSALLGSTGRRPPALRAWWRSRCWLVDRALGAGIQPRCAKPTHPPALLLTGGIRGRVRNSSLQGSRVQCLAQDFNKNRISLAKYHR